MRFASTFEPIFASMLISDIGLQFEMYRLNLTFIFFLFFQLV